MINPQTPARTPGIPQTDTKSSSVWLIQICSQLQTMTQTRLLVQRAHFTPLLPFTCLLPGVTPQTTWGGLLPLLYLHDRACSEGLGHLEHVFGVWSMLKEESQVKAFSTWQVSKPSWVASL